MAMSPEVPPGGGAVPGPDPLLLRARDELRATLTDRWVEVADRVVARALTATRRALPIRAEASSGPVHVSEQVLIAHVRAAVADVPGCEPTAIVIRNDGRDGYTGVLVAVTARYGVALLPLADQVRDAAARVLRTLLGPVVPPVTVSTMQVHVGDVE